MSQAHVQARVGPTQEQDQDAREHRLPSSNGHKEACLLQQGNDKCCAKGTVF